MTLADDRARWLEALGNASPTTSNRPSCSSVATLRLYLLRRGKSGATRVRRAESQRIWRRHNVQLFSSYLCRPISALTAAMIASAWPCWSQVKYPRLLSH